MIETITHCCGLCGSKDVVKYENGQYICEGCAKVKFLEVDSRCDALEIKDSVADLEGSPLP